MESKNEFKQKCLEILHNSTVKDLDIVKVVELDSNISLYDAFSLLIEKSFLSAPVYDSATKEYTGFLDIRDLAGFVVFVHDEQNFDNNTQLADLIKHGSSQFKTATTDGLSVKYLSRRNRFHPVTMSSTLYEVVQGLCLPDVRRVPVLEDGKVVTIVAQSNIIKFLAKKIALHLDSNEPTVDELEIATKPVLSVHKSESVINTFRKMEKQQKSGIAIVDAQNKLIGATTAKDLGLFIKHPTLQFLQSHIFDYLKIIRQQSIDERAPSISVYATDKLSKAVGLLAATRVHRIFIVDNEDDFQPVGVLSITDVFKFLLK